VMHVGGLEVAPHFVSTFAHMAAIAHKRVWWWW
jgi:hypothetical protein